MDAGKSVLSKSLGGWMNRIGFPEQHKWFDSLNVDMLDDEIFRFAGIFVHRDCWEKPDDSDVQDFLECQLEDPEFRLLKFNFDGKLSQKENELFKNWIVEHYSDPEYSEGIYVATFTHDKEKLEVVTSRRGHSWEGVQTEILGIFQDFDEGKSFMFEENGVFF